MLSTFPSNASPTTLPRSDLVIPAVLFLDSILVDLNPLSASWVYPHGLLIRAAAWTILGGVLTIKVGVQGLLDVENAKRRTAWLVAGLLVLAQVCERSVEDHGGREILLAQALLPALIWLSFGGDAISDESAMIIPLEHDSSRATSPTKQKQIVERTAPRGSSPPRLSSVKLAIITAAASVAVHTSSGDKSLSALALSYGVIQALAFRIFEGVRNRTSQRGREGSEGGQSTEAWSDNTLLIMIRDVAAAATLFATTAAFMLESMKFGSLQHHGRFSDFGIGVRSVGMSWGTMILQAIMCGLQLVVVFRHGAFIASFVPLAAAVCSQLLLSFSPSRLWFSGICLLSLFDERSAFAGSRMKFRFSRILGLVALLSFAVLAIYRLRQPLTVQNTPLVVPVSGLNATLPETPLDPLQYGESHVHPIKSLVQDAQASWQKKLESQSKTLAEAVREYQRRYGIPPPPHFDKWYAFAKSKDVQLIDEYDTIYHSLLPFWALSPATIRARTREALGFADNNLMGLLIRNGAVVHVEGGQDWLQEAAAGMMAPFLNYLPDMDLAFNTHDEPRVVVPHDELARLIQLALETNMPKIAAQPSLKNAYSRRAADLGPGKRIGEVKTTRFNVFSHQATWIPSRMSCSPDSPARALEESLEHDNLTAYALGDLGFVYNQTAFSDICNSPSFGKSHGFFDRPNAFSVVHDLFPIFSQSKMSSFQDIVFPSPWYWFGKVKYDGDKDKPWTAKENRLWWRGSTTGGFSRAGGWKRQHRQNFVRRVNALGEAKILMNSNAAATDENPESKWITKTVSRQDFKEIIDVHFTHVGQCDPGDCDAQREFFDLAPPADQQDAWNYKYLLDLDGNAFSGRFYAFLMSHSLTFKMAVFREWHEEWIKPWVHYIPLSLRADEALEAVRFFDAEEEGRPLAIAVAEQGREWAGRALRNEDFEVWFFRLLLEYGRLVDDNRYEIGFSGA
ncbi:unnamed protein product [Zymoseptoria tritici ST99CH_1E4]|uniref:Glycosyl transferase CAP10 domain-containing protein n=1 Tax=Zymoseptoria tritici ST99CH_1E4 TaxID=1276532 RepID=A0A2H1FM63_ZYMTR|nr:unnamed protein product [Zymoseptoria tritici ST99CH_1E4]